MKKLLCFDLDGTLLRDDKSIPQNNIEAVKRAINAGCSVSIVTGRSYNSSIQIAKELDLIQENCYLISFQGNAVFSLWDHKLIYESGLQKKEVVSILKDLNANGLYGHTFDYDGIISNDDCTNLRLYNSIASEPVTFLDNWDKLKDRIYPKVIAIDFSSSKGLEHYQKKNLEIYEKQRIACFFSDPKFLEFTAISSSKGNAVLELAKHLKIATEDIISIGDERNDISMISAAGIGCAVANARSEAKEVADYITENNNNQGAVAEVIERFIFS